MPTVDSITYTHQTNPRSKSIKMRIDPSGEVIVTTPRFTPQLLIDHFVKNNKVWISRQLEKQAAMPLFNSPSQVVIFNKTYAKKAQYDARVRSGISISGQTVIYNLLSPPENTPTWDTTAEEALTRFLKSTARAYIIPRTTTVAQQMKITFERISLKEQKTRWGSCSSRGNLNFNWRLVHFKPKIIDYVIVHELAHRKHMDHSHRFWQLVGQYDPEYSKHRGWLKRQGGSVG